MLTNSSKHIILFGFCLVLACMSALAMVGLSRMDSLNARIQSIAHDNNIKSDLISSMRAAIRERFISLYNLSVITDPFDEEAELDHYHQLAANFLNARAQLLKMPLSPQEKHVLAEQARLLKISYAIQKQVAALISVGDRQAAGELLQSQAIPARNRVLAELGRLQDMQHAATEKAVKEARQTYRHAYLNMLALAAAALGVGLFVAFYVSRRVGAVEEALFQEKELAEITLYSIGDAVITADAAGLVTYVNPAAEQLTGWNALEARHRPLTEIFQAVDEHLRQPLELPAIQDFLEGLAVGTVRHTVLINRYGQDSIIEHSVAPIRSRAGRIMGTVLVFRDVSEARRMEQQLYWQASHDALTGLANRRAFEQRLFESLAAARAHDQSQVLIYFDLDQFKVVNDTCGHIAGDALLRQITALLEEQIQPHDILARLGGDEFGLLLENCPLSRGVAVAETLRQAISEFRFVWADKAFSISVSIGIVPITPRSETVTDLLSAADTACYAAKDQGRNRIHVYESDNGEWMKRHGEMLWVSRINKALEEKRLRLFYQFILPTNPSRARKKHVEVLLRMVDENGHLVLPMAFIPAAERYNLMPAVDRWVIQNTFGWLVEFILKTPKKLIPCAINLSGQSLCDDQFLDFVIDQFQRSGVPPSAICFEITETAAIANLNQAIRFISKLKSMGCRFALDDFGSGMSSFTYLKNLPVDYLKIDGAFVRDMLDDPVDQAMVEAIHRIGHVMGIQTIAEFVESPATLERLKALGVDYVQGYSIHKPEPIMHLAEVQLSA